MGGKQAFGDFVLDVKTHSSIGKHAHILSLYKHIVLSLRTLLRITLLTRFPAGSDGIVWFTLLSLRAGFVLNEWQQ